MKYKVENESSNYKSIIDSIIFENKEKIFNFFNCEVCELDFNIYIYDSIESLVLGLRKRGFSKDPDYMCACFKDEDNSLNFFEPKDNPNENEWSKEEYEIVIFHELVHAIQFSLFGSTPEWLNEGIAKFLDGTYSKGIGWLLENYINKIPIPNQKEIEEEFGMHEYDSYDYAYLMVCYLIETQGKDYLIELLKDENKLNLIKDNLLEKAIDYYNDKNIKEKFLRDFPIPNGSKIEPYIILFDAYTGQGKSTVSKIISKYDQSIILNNDEVRNWLDDYSDKSNLKNELQNYRLELLLKNNNSCICDSCFCHNWREKIKYYDELGFKYYIIRLECSDEVVKERLEKRVKDNDNYSIANYNDYLWMKENVPHVDDNLISYVINTEDDIEEQVKELLDKYSLR